MTTIDQLGMSHADNGLYVEKTQTRPEVHLTPNEDGTFLFPPTQYGSTPGKSELGAYVTFWTSAPISDGVLTNITSGYADLVRRQKIVEGHAWAARYDVAHRSALTTGSAASQNAAQVERDRAYEEFFANWHVTNPAKIRAASARSIARAGQLSFFATALSDEDGKQVDDSTLNINGVDMTVSQIVEQYRLGELRDYFQDPDATAAERLEDLRQELRKMQKIG